MKKALFGLLAALALAVPLAHLPQAHAADPKAPAVQKAAEKIDVNSASAEQLASLKGIGPVRAQAIIDGRPYKGKDDLPRRKIIPQSVYDQIKDDIIAKQK